MSFKTRMTLAVAAAVAIAIAAAAAAAYVAARNELVGQVDSYLKAEAAQLDEMPADRLLFYHGPFNQQNYQVVDATGRPQTPSASVLAVTGATKEVAAGKRKPFFSEAQLTYKTTNKTHRIPVRVFTFQYAPGLAVQVVVDISSIQQAMHRLRWILALVAALGIVVASLLALLVTRWGLRPVRRLTAQTEHVAETRDLTTRMEENGGDELARLAASFNTMLSALEDSLRAQRQLVADASHELRTPLTSLRTNIEVLARSDVLPPAEREKLLEDVVEQLTEMSTLVSELVQVARGDQPAGDPETLRLDELVAESVERARRNAPGIRFETELQPSTVEAVPFALERAVGNLLDNAAKWSPPGGAVEVAVVDHEVQVRDHGPGIDEADVPFVFDRFYRAAAARGMPGSGLGLAIVKQVADSHGGEVLVERPADGGTRMRLKLPA